MPEPSHGRLSAILLARQLERAAAGDPRAFRSAFRSLYPVVLGFFTARLSGRADAEDLTSEVFRRLLENLGSFDRRRGSPRAWVLSIARNRLIDHFRTRRPETPLEDSEAALAQGSWSEPDEDDDEILQRVRAALADCPAQTREMFALRFGDGLRYAEIASVLGLSEAAVKQRFSRTLRELRAKARQGAKEVGYAH